MKMQNRSRMINKLALVLLSIVILELVLIGNQVQPVKAIKKKIFLKKLKKLLPLLALVKPKKKLILVPIPIPMFNKQPFFSHPGPGLVGAQPMMMMTAEGSSPPLVGVEPSVGSTGPPTMQMVELSGLEPASMGPSMTMTIQSDGMGGTSGIELSTSLMPGPSNSSSGALKLQHQMRSAWAQQHAPASSTKWQAHQQQQQQFDQYDFDPISEQLQQQQKQTSGGEHYYSSPWSALSRDRRPLASPAKLLRNERLRKQQQLFGTTPQQLATSMPRVPMQQTAIGSSRLHQAPRPHLMPVLVIKNQWTPTGQQRAPVGGQARSKSGDLKQQQQQQLEPEQLVQVGPAQLMPIYQTSNGQLHVTPPPAAGPPPKRPQPAMGELEQEDPQGAGDANPNVEVQTVSSQSGALQEPSFGSDEAGSLATTPAAQSHGSANPSGDQHHQSHQPTVQQLHQRPEPYEPKVRQQPASNGLVKAKQQHQANKRKPIGGGY